MRLLNHFIPLLIVASASAIAAQERSAQQDTSEHVIRRETKLVQVPVIVSDSKGRRLRGLKPEDFSVFENGVERRIDTFEEITETASGSVPRRPVQVLPEGTYSNAVSVQHSTKPILIVIYDIANMTFESQARMRTQLIKFLKTVPYADQRICLFASSRGGLVPLHLYTTDPAVLIRALERLGMSTNPPSEVSAVPPLSTAQVPLGGDFDLGLEMRMMNAMMKGNDIGDGFSLMSRVSSSYTMLHSLKALAGYFKTVPGRKSLLWISGVMPLDVGTGQSSDDYAGTYLSALEALVNANIVIYTIDPEGLRPNQSFPIMTGQQARNPLGPSMFRQEDARTVVNFGANQFDWIGFGTYTERMRDVAERTGGLAFYNNNDTVELIQRAIRDGAQHYLLGYYLPPDAKPGRYPIQIKVKQRGARLRYRNRLFVSQPEVADKEALEAAKHSFLEFTDLPIAVKIPPTATPGKEITFDVMVEGSEFGINEQNGVDLDLVAVARKPDGKLIEHVSRSIKGQLKDATDFKKRKLTFSSAFTKVREGAVLRFIVRDNISGRIGSVIVDRP